MIKREQKLQNMFILTFIIKGKKNMLYQYSNYLAIYIATQRVFDKAHKVGLRLIETMATFSTRSPMKK
jgi:hypothetical protein